ncbi:MAG: PEP-CTERM sorting domain-containing protein [Candidatus Taylorbacteria bacterium]
MKTSSFRLISLVLLLTLPDVARAQEFGLVSTHTSIHYAPGPGGDLVNFGNFSISFEVTSSENLFIRSEDYSQYNHNFPIATLQLDLNSFYDPVQTLMNSGSEIGDTSEWYVVPEGQRRIFQVVLENFVAPQTGLYSLGLNFFEITHDPEGGDLSYLILDEHVFRTDQLYLSQVVPEPSSIIILFIGGIALVAHRRR